jgi:hypothetical protein
VANSALRALLGAQVLLLAACTPAPAASSSEPSPSGSVEAQSSPSPPPDTPAPQPPAAANQSGVAVDFTGLPPGSYPVHLHTVCNGSQAFHITVLDSLGVGSDGTGGIRVPSTDAGRGWCVIVYGDQSLARVLVTRPI